MPVEDRYAVARELAQVPQAVADQVRSVRSGEERRPGTQQPRPGRRFGDRGDVDAAACQLAGDLEVERSVAGDEDAGARRHAVGTHQRLGGARRHDPRQRPPGHRVRSLVGPGRDDNLAREVTNGPAVAHDADIEPVHVRIGERAPHRCPAHDLHAGPPYPVDEGAAVRVLTVRDTGIRKVVARRELLVILPAGLRALVEDGDPRPGAGRRLRRGEPARTGPDHEHAVGRVLDDRCRKRRERRECIVGRGRRCRTRQDSHPLGDLRHARALARPSVDPHQAVEADAHPAEHAARLAPIVGAQRADSGRGERRRHRLALERRHRPCGEEESRPAVSGGRTRASSGVPETCAVHRPRVEGNPRGHPPRQPRKVSNRRGVRTRMVSISSSVKSFLRIRGMTLRRMWP